VKEVCTSLTFLALPVLGEICLRLEHIDDVSRKSVASYPLDLVFTGSGFRLNFVQNLSRNCKASSISSRERRTSLPAGVSCS
jgi:hypothetical protein